MSFFPFDSFTTPTAASTTSSGRSTERSAPPAPPRLALKKRMIQSDIHGSKTPLASPHHHQAKAKLQERKRLVKTAPRVPDVLGGELDDDSFPLARLPIVRLRMRPSKEDATRTPTQRVSFVPSTVPRQTPETSPDAVVPPLLPSLPARLMFPDIPGSDDGYQGRKQFVLKPKPLSRSFSPRAVAGTS